MKHLKTAVRQAIRWMLSQKPIWTLVRHLGLDRHKFLAWHRRSALARQDIERALERLRGRFATDGLIVQSGLFAGMRYASFASCGSTLMPKLLGTYECELHPVLKEFLTIDFPVVVDVGCAEGYYAVGLALRLPGARILAYDTDRRARKLCMEMAAINSVDDRVSVQGECGPAVLAQIDFSNGGLVVSDCEGYEKQLFCEMTAKTLRNAHLLIELHDLSGSEIRDHIVSLFEKTHDIQVIPSLPDDDKQAHYHSPLVSPDDMIERLVAFSEYRRVISHWAVLTPKERSQFPASH
jgi:precorrin-6B methylase 2